MLKAIETLYAGCRFRSRLEARWAVFFDHLGIPWEYEPQGFVTSAGPYLPDFRLALPEAGETAWFEVKPDGAPDDPRHQAFADEQGEPLVVARDMPRSCYADQQREGHCSGRTGSALRVLLPDAPPSPAAFVGADWGLDPQLPGVPYSLHFNGGDMWDHLHKGRRWYQDAPLYTHIALYAPHAWTPGSSPSVDAAYTAARSARFEFGETGGR